MTDTTPPDPTNPDLRPGDEADPATDNAAEAPCPQCGGSGEQEGGGACPVCSGTGVVIQGVGGG